MGGSPGLVVKGGDSCSKGRGFESWHRILEGHFFTYICCKNVMLFEKNENKTIKEGGLAHLKKSKKIKIIHLL